MSDRTPILVLAVGNPSRGDDAIGPALACADRRGAAAGGRGDRRVPAAGREHARPRRPEAGDFRDAGTGTPAPCELRRVQPAAEFLHTSHALSPEAVLATYRRVTGHEPPEAWVLCVRGESFELGEGFSAAAQENLEAAWLELLGRLRASPG